MNRFIIAMLARTGLAPFAPSRRRGRGSVLVLVLGVLAILSIAALSYVTIVRLDRASSVSSGRREGFQSQVDTVIEELRAVVGADLWGNKIVDPTVPEDQWPSMFEDGESRDVPFTDLTTFNAKSDPQDASLPDTAASILNARSSLSSPFVALPDDAWLAPTEPERLPAPDYDLSPTWSQVSNIRSAYRWRDDTQQWVRGDGRFVDLGGWFFAARDGAADPSVSLIDWSEPAIATNAAIGPINGTSGLTPNNSEVFDLQMNALEGLTPDELRGAPTNSDLRQWADTDGDFRPDARWTVIDTLTGGGLNWVVATRIIDASSLVNVNTAIELGLPNDAGIHRALGDGSTPADVDLYRLLVGSARPNSDPYDYEVRVDRLEDAGGAFATHLFDGLNSEELLQQIFDSQDAFITDRGITDTYDTRLCYPALDTYSTRPWRPNQRLTIEQRRVLWDLFGVNPQRPLSRLAVGYPTRDVADLAAFHATNNLSLISRTEQIFDGTESDGYLPGLQSANPERDNYGPLRSKETSTLARRYTPVGGDPVTDGLPTLDMIKYSTRRLLTTVSGTGLYNPVPALNRRDRNPYQSISSLEKLRVDRSLRATGNVNGSANNMQQAFASFLWALAPTLTDEPLSRTLDSGNAFGLISTDAHYGGGPTGPARRLYPDPGGAWNSTFAIVTAASMAANLADAVDRDLLASGSDRQSTHTPTVLRVFNRRADTDQPETLARRELNTFNGETYDEFYLNLSMPQGDVPITNALRYQNGGSINDLPQAEPYVIVGQERTPYISEAFVMVVLSNREQSDGTDDNTEDGVVGGDESTWGDAIGCVFAVELYNPWDTEISTEGLSIVLPDTPDLIDATPADTSDRGPVRFDFGTTSIEPGQRRVFNWRTAGYSPAWNAIRDAYDNSIGALAAGDRRDINVDANDPTLRVPFWHLMANPAARPVLLMRGPYLLDRLSPPTSSDYFPPSVGDGGATLFDFSSGIVENLGAPPGDSYFSSRGWSPDEDVDTRNRIDNSQFTGRLMVTASMTRPFARSSFDANGTFVSSGQGGIIESPSLNAFDTNRVAHYWLYPYNVAVDVSAAFSSRDRADHIITNGDIPDPIVLDFPDSHWDMGLSTKRADSNNPNLSLDVAPFQLFVPDRGIQHLSEIMEIGVYASTYAASKPGMSDDMNDLRLWRTAGEKLALSLNYDHRDTTPLDGSNTGNNIHLGKLDPSRFVLGQMGFTINGVPDTMSIPLALRVVEPFECVGSSPCTQPSASNVGSSLIPGRININTAPLEVLDTLPLVNTEFEITDANAGDRYGAPLPESATPGGGTANRRDIIAAYRDENTINDMIAPLPIAGTLPTGLRRNPNTGNAQDTIGFATPAELAILGNWNVATGQPTPGSNVGTFLELGADRDRNDFPPLQSMRRWRESQLAIDSDLDGTVDSTTLDSDSANVLGAGGTGVTDTNPVEDAEERLALYRAVSNIASTRSDVFIAWVVIRGYDPESIETIDITNNPTEELVNSTMDNQDNNFTPVHESRWLVVLDRSQNDSGLPLRRPTDRPRVLMKIELPSVAP